MGTFRFILAFAVLIAHVATSIGDSVINRNALHILVWSGNAVFAFFIISGFYMSLIINTKYAKLPAGAMRFYANRALRLYPIQWILLALYALVCLADGTHTFLLGYAREPFGRWVYAMFSNVFFLGAEVLPFFDKANWAFVIGPIWSLSLEMYFYLLAPFIVARSLRTLLLVCAAALSFRLALYLSGAPLLPWRYFFFPADLVFFLIGAVSYRVYALLEDSRAARHGGVVAAILLTAYVACPWMWTAPDLDQPLSWCFYGCVAVATPFLFALTRNWRIDNFIGQLSYPVYLSHIFVIGAVKQFGHSRFDKGLVATVLTLALSIALYFFIDRPVEVIRRRIVSCRRTAIAGRDRITASAEA